MTKTLRISDLPTNDVTEFGWTPSRREMDEIAKRLDLLGLRKMRLEGTLSPQGSTDWKLHAKLGATVVQPCVVTLEPVTTRIDAVIRRIYISNWVEPEDSELELEAGEDSDPLPDLIDLAELGAEALSLELPLNPRSPEAAKVGTNFGPDGVEPLTNETSKPFAGLADLKKKLESGDQ